MEGARASTKYKGSGPCGAMQEAARLKLKWLKKKKKKKCLLAKDIVTGLEREVPFVHVHKSTCRWEMLPGT